MYRNRWALALFATSLLAMPTVIAKESAEDFARSQQQAPDDTSKNKRDKKLEKVTADNQSNKKSDVALTAEVRKAVMAEKGISTDGQNVKIVTRSGVMTLRGPVDNESEKELIGRLAKESGAKAVTNQLEVKKQ